jgi:hypothetical protein
VDVEKQVAYVGTDNGIIAFVNLREKSPFVICKLFVCQNEAVTDLFVDANS